MEKEDNIINSINLLKPKSLLKDINIEFIKIESDIFVLYDVLLNNISIGNIKVVYEKLNNLSSYKTMTFKYVLFPNDLMVPILHSEHSSKTLDEVKTFIYNKISKYTEIVKTWEQ